MSRLPAAMAKFLSESLSGPPRVSRTGDFWFDAAICQECKTQGWNAEKHGGRKSPEPE